MTLRSLADIRQDERWGAGGAFLTLIGLMAGHTLLETARDALFLARLPASELAWVYLIIAGLAVGISQAQQKVLERFRGPYLLGAMLVASAGVTIAFWWLTGWRGLWVFYALYVWSSVFATVVTVQFWLVIGGAYTVTQAKRVYGFIGAGSVVGAIAGASAGRVLTHLFHDARPLLMACAAVLALSAIGPVTFLRGMTNDDEVRRRRFGLRENLPLLRDDPYLRRIALMVLVSTIAFTLIDFLFKSVVKDHVAPVSMASFFATLNVVLNVLSLLAQVAVVPWLMRALGVTRAVLVVPALLLVTSLGVAASAGLLAVLVMKGADGTFRYSLHRTTTELLYLPVPGGLRSRVKGIIDGLGQRGGQAVGSVAILAAGFLSQSRVVLGVVVALLSLVWTSAVVGLRNHYLELFRSALRAGAVETRIQLPQLDMRSLETFIAALNSENDAEVLAALDLLDDQGKAHLIPALILYHPSRDVVLRALAIFARSRKDFVSLAKRLLKHSDPEVRAAALAARSAVEVDADLLRRSLEDPSPEVSTTALVHLVANRLLDAKEGDRALLEIAERGSPEQHAALLRAIAAKPAPVFEGALLRLAERTDLPATPELAEVMGSLRSAAFVPALMQMLAKRELLLPAREALVAIGDPALEALDRALDARAQPPHVLRHLPRTISRFDPEKAAPILMRHLRTAPDGMVRYKVLRGLGRLTAANPRIELDPEVLDEVTDRTAREVLCMIDWRLGLEHGAREVPSRASMTHELLTTLLENKERLALERLFRLLGLRFPEEDFERIYRGLSSADDKLRSSSRELVEALVKEPLRRAILAILDEAPDEERLRRAAPYYDSEARDYEEQLEAMLTCWSESLRCLAAYHVGEVGLERLRPALEAAMPPATNPLASVVSRALTMLDARRKARMARAG